MLNVISQPFLTGALSLAMLACLSTGAKAANNEGTNVRDLLELSIEELMNIQVFTVTRRPEGLSSLPAAIHVITNADIRRSGATTLPDLLRLAPGMHVAQVHANQWAVGVRGFTKVFATKLLVMIDGRSIYSPLFSGVFWDSHDLILQDIDRIEVIRGPGASVWGANAMNGVVNIITKSAVDTQGTLVSGIGGNIDRFVGSIRHGGMLNDDHAYRVYLKHRDHAALRAVSPPGADDSWNLTQGGFRTDRRLSEISNLTFQGDIGRGEFKQTYIRTTAAPPYEPYLEDGRIDTRNGNLLGRITRSLNSDSDVRLQAYVDVYRRNTPVINEDRFTADLDFQHSLPTHERQMITWGTSYRVTYDEVESSFDVALDPDSRTMHLFSIFVNDRIEAVPDRLFFEVGSKFEHTEFTGFEAQPSASVTWMPQPEQTLWGKIARAVRLPSRAECDIRLNLDTPGQPFVTSIFGGSDLTSEELIAYELGYRVRPLEDLSIDIAVFYNDYDNIRGFTTGQLTSDPPPEHFQVITSNAIKGETHGFGVSANWNAAEFWRLYGSYSFLRIHMRRKELEAVEAQSRVELIEGSSPGNQWLLRSSFDLPNDLEWDTWFRYVGNIPAQNIDRYLEMDMRIGWKRGDLEIALVGRNLLQRRHQEFLRSRFVRAHESEIPRAFHATLSWNF